MTFLTSEEVRSMLAAANLPTDVRRFQQWRKKRVKKGDHDFPVPLKFGRLLKFRSTEVTEFIFKRQRSANRFTQLIKIEWLEPPTEDQRLRLESVLFRSARDTFPISSVKDTELPRRPRHNGHERF
jgi:hypothetical protein